MEIHFTPEFITTLLTLLVSLLTLAYVFGGLKKEIASLKENFKNLEKRIDAIEKRIDAIDARLRHVEIEIAQIKATMSFMTGSPLKLSKRGEQVIGEIGGEEIVNKNFEMFSSKVVNRANKWQIQNQSFKVIKEALPSILTEENQEKLYAIGADDKQTINALGILLRDKIINSLLKQ